MKSITYNKVKGVQKLILHFSLFAFTLSMMLASCANDDDRIPDVTAAICPSSIEMAVPAEQAKLIYTDNTGADVLPLVVGESVQLGYSLEPADATFNSVVWTTSDASVATVDNGKVVALSERGLGYSLITVAPTGMFSGSGVLSALKVKVVAHLQQASEIALSAETTEVYEGEQIALGYTIEPEATTYRTLEWTSSDQSVAKVDSKGVVTGISTGGTNSKNVTITGKAMDGSGVSASIDITVKRVVQPQEVTLDLAATPDDSPSRLFALNEQGAQLTYTTVPAESTQCLIEWSSSDESVATVEAGYVKFVGFGEVTITATCPETQKSSSVKLNIPVGLLRETFHNPNHYSVYNATQSGNGTSSSHEWHDGYITITTYSQNATNQRADIKWWDTPATLHAGNYPVVAIKVDDVKDLYKEEGVTARNINFDVVGKSESGADFKALGNGNNKYTGDLKCSDGSHVFIYDLSTLAFGTGGIAPTNESISFNTFQLKYADIKTIDHQITYNLYWFQTFKSVDEVKQYVTEVDKLTYEVIK